MTNIIKFEKPDNPANVEALRSMVFAVRLAMDIGMDKKNFLLAAKDVWDGVIASNLAEEIGDGR